jgi:predicted nucleic acid-binding protein
VILVDTSAWVDFFRGRGRLCDRVDQALDADEAALCGPVITELRRGLQSTRERTRVLSSLAGCHLLSRPSDLWEEAGDLGFLLRRKGTTVRSLDLLIATYALAHGVPILSDDSDFRLMQRAGLAVQLVEV